MEKKLDKCPTCGKEAHDYEKTAVLNCVPPLEVLRFGSYLIDKKYRKALFDKHPNYTAEEVVGSFLGHNEYFPSQNDWLLK